MKKKGGWLAQRREREVEESPPTSRSDSLGVVGPGVEGGRGEETTNESR